MADYSDATERFVEIPGIVEIRWVSDDPDYYEVPIDLLNEQRENWANFVTVHLGRRLNKL